MAEIINLRMARKRRVRTQAEDRAAENRVRHGRTKAEKQAAAIDEARQQRIVDGARLEPDDEV